MKFTSAVTLLAAVASAMPAATEADARQTYSLVTRTKPRGGKYEGFDIGAAHTGAGTNFPAIGGDGLTFYFNGTYLQANIGKYPYGLGFGSVEDSYAQWGAMTLNSGSGDKGWFRHKGILDTKNKNVEFNGFRICNSVHGQPELYFDIYEDASVPCNCEKTDLVLFPNVN